MHSQAKRGHGNNYSVYSCLNIAWKVNLSKNLIHKSIDKGLELANGRELIIAAFGGEPGMKFELLQEMFNYRS